MSCEQFSRDSTQASPVEITCKIAVHEEHDSGFGAIQSQNGATKYDNQKLEMKGRI